MGEAKRKRAVQGAAGVVVYHHTSILVTNRIWMDGVLKPDGPGADTVAHPKLEAGVKFGGERTRRACQDFPPLVWFTTRIAIPPCMMNGELIVTFPNGRPDEATLGKVAGVMAEAVENLSAADMMNFRMWNRVALGFQIADIPVTPWCSHYGYDTTEGRDLNTSAIEAGDNPDDWFVSEQEIDVLKVSEFWSSPSVSKPRLERVRGDYIGSIRRMVTLCQQGRANGEGVYIPPAWMDLTSQEKQGALSRKLGVPVVEG
jgi:hypothetical protein